MVDSIYRFVIKGKLLPIIQFMYAN